MVHPTFVREEFRPGQPGLWTHPDWELRFPWLVQGTTGAGPDLGHAPTDFAFFPVPAPRGGRASWLALGSRLGFPTVIHSHQVHQKTVLIHDRESTAPQGVSGPEVPESKGELVTAPDADGHVTGSEGLLLGVTGADCVPVFVVDSSRRVIALLHAGWRGTVAGILEEGLEVLAAEFGSLPPDLFVHLGPSICGECYEVGSEVHAALGLPDPGESKPVDLKDHLAGRAVGMGVLQARLSQSEWCTLCGGSGFFSHRGGDNGRQVGFMGIRSHKEDLLSQGGPVL
jgi:YfiH family protein